MEDLDARSLKQIVSHACMDHLSRHGPTTTYEEDFSKCVGSDFEGFQAILKPLPDPNAEMKEWMNNFVPLERFEKPG